MADKKCVSCKAVVANDNLATSFSCPKCGNEPIVRCGQCRKTAVTYKCLKCGFEGP